jgi:putative tryptophan/tyrosine transport system substrate-binding protein
MRRREFIELAGGAIALTAGRTAQPRSAELPRVGILQGFRNDFFDALIGELRNAGYIDRENLILEVRFFGTSVDRLDEFASELVTLKSALIFAANPYAIRSAMKATSTIPIIAIDLEDDPVTSGWAQSLARPGGNLTGFFLDIPELGGKLIQLARELVPTASYVAVLWDSTIGDPQFHATELAARAAGVRLTSLPVKRPEEIKEALEAQPDKEPQALVVLSSPLIFSRLSQIADFARQRRLPTVSLHTSFPRVGGLVAYGPDTASMFMRAASYIERVLSGTKPADLPIERPSRFELIINMKTAEALDLTIAPLVLARADEVIE